MIRINTCRIAAIRALISAGLVATTLVGTLTVLGNTGASGTWANTGSLNTVRENHRATLLENGDVLASGGVGDGSYLTSAELYDPSSGTWSFTGSMNTARERHTS